MRRVLLLLASFCAFPASAETLKNHYNDPFIQVTGAIKNCPQPRGPFMSERDAKAEAHQRIERGTTCFNEGKCRQANAYFYDADIARRAAQAARDAIIRDRSLATSSVWITVQRRFVFIQGCVKRPEQIAQWEAIMKSVADVDYVSADLAVGTRLRSKRMPYPTMSH